MIDFLRNGADAGTREVLLRMIVCLGCIAGLLISWKLWVSSRSYPLVPISEKLPAIRPPFDYVVFAALVILPAMIAFSSRPRRFVFAFLFLAICLCALDQSRLQPWFYQYTMLLAAFAFYSSAARHTQLLNTSSLIISLVYFWSGVQKIGVGFVDRVFPVLINPYLHTLFGRVDVLPRWLIPAIPLIEIFIGVGLMTRKLRNVSAVIAVAMHLLILLLLVPLGVNRIVWPWNIAMIVLVMVLFWKRRDASLADLVLPKRVGFQLFVLILFGVMPLLSFFNLWDAYLSSSLYSGNYKVAVIRITDAVKNRLQAGIQNQVEQVNGEWTISPVRWSLRELKVPAYPEPRVYRKVTKSICAFAEDPTEVILTIYSEPHVLTGERTATTYNCEAL